jgi:hypothetical protein
MRSVPSALLLALVATTGCATIPEPRILGEVEAVRRSPSVIEARRLAPAAVSKGDALAIEARRVLDEGATGAAGAAQHLSEAALAAYEVARATARTVIAERRREEAAGQRGGVAEQLTAVEGDLLRESGEVTALERDLAVLEELELPRASGTAGAEREAARRVAARSLALDARLFCASARLLGAPAAGLDPVAAEVASVEEALAGAGPTPIDRATRARAACLEQLTQVRRKAARAAGPSAPVDLAASPDALLAELSAAKLEPSRDERGVVVVVREAFEGDGLSKRASARLAELDRVAAAHAAFPVLVVVHDAKVAGDKDAARGKARAEAAARAMPSAQSRVRGEWAGAAAPLADPRGPSSARNTRLEVVFVAPLAF